MLRQHGSEVVFHGGQYQGLAGLGLGQVDLGDDEAEGGGGSGGDFVGGLPVGGLGGVLVAGHTGPGGAVVFGKVRQQDARGLEGNGHGNSFRRHGRAVR